MNIANVWISYNRKYRCLRNLSPLYQDIPDYFVFRSNLVALSINCPGRIHYCEGFFKRTLSHQHIAIFYNF